MGTMINVNGLRVKQTRELKKLTQTELATKIGVAQSTIAKMETNVREWPNEIVEALAFQTGFPVSFFQQGLGPEFPMGSLLFRCRASLNGSEKAHLRQYSMLEFEIAEKLSNKIRPLPLHLPSFSSEDPKVAAKITRTTLGLPPHSPISHLINKLEKNGIVVLALPDGHEKFDAFSLWSDGDPRKPIVVVNGNKSGDRIRMSTAHELGHLVLHKSPRGNLSEIETEAKQFSAEFLLPEEAIRSEVGHSPTLTDIAKLKPRWGVAIQALVYRLHELKLLSDRQYRYMFEQISKNKWRKHEPANLAIETERPRLFRKLAEMHYGIPIPAEKVAALVSLPTHWAEMMIDAHASKGQMPKGEKGIPVTVIDKPVNADNVLRFSKRS